MSSRPRNDWAPWLGGSDEGSDSRSNRSSQAADALSSRQAKESASRRRDDLPTASRTTPDPTSPVHPPSDGDREHAILDAAEALLRQGGEAALTMDALAARLGISRATLYRRVGSREALVSRLVDERALPAGMAETGADELRRRILRAMRDLLPREGVRGTTMERVAKEAGVGSATVYRHFGDREGLVRAFAAEFSPRRAAGRLEREPSEDIRGDLTELAAELIRFVRENHDLVRLRFSGDPEAQAFFEDLRSTPERFSFALQRYFREQAAAGRLNGRDPDTLAMAFMGLLIGCTLARPPGWEALEDDEAAAAETLVALYLDGAGSALEERTP